MQPYAPPHYQDVRTTDDCLMNFANPLPTPRNLQSAFDACLDPKFNDPLFDDSEDCDSDNIKIETAVCYPSRIEKPTIEIDLEDIDTISQETFKTLLQQNRDQKMPYFIAVLPNNYRTTPEILDAKNFLFSRFYKGNDSSPLKNKIKSFKIYKSHQNEDTFKFFCDQNTLRNEYDHCAKYINACSVNLEPFKRGQERFYLSMHFYQKASVVEDDIKAFRCYQKSQFWLNKAMEDKEPSAYFEMGVRLLEGTVFEEPAENIQEGIQFLKYAAHIIPNNDKNASSYKACLQTFKDAGGAV